MIRTLACTVLVALSLLTACGGDSPSAPPVDPATVVTKVTIGALSTSLAVGGTLQLTADAANAAGTILVGKTFNWVSSRPDVASVTSLGFVTAIATGTTVISAANGSVSATMTLSVQAPNKIVLTSDAGDWVGGGATYTYTKANAILGVSANASTIQVSVSGNQGWSGTFKTPVGVQLAAGSYSNALRYPFQGNSAGVSWTGEGRGCNTVTGLFVVDSLTWSAGIGSTLLSLDMHFEQHCEGGSTALRGTIHWRSDDPTLPPGPVTPIPSNLWQPPTGATPAAGDFVYLQSEQGDYIGQGATSLYQTGLAVTSNGARLSVSAGGYGGTFQGMTSIATLTIGYYGNLQRYPFNSPIAGGLDWSGNGRGCNTLSGWFAIDRINYVNGVLMGVELRFEQHCEGGTSALRGALRWGQFTN